MSFFGILTFFFTKPCNRTILPFLIQKITRAGLPSLTPGLARSTLPRSHTAPRKPADKAVVKNYFTTERTAFRVTCKNSLQVAVSIRTVLPRLAGSISRPFPRVRRFVKHLTRYRYEGALFFFGGPAGKCAILLTGQSTMRNGGFA